MRSYSEANVIQNIEETRSFFKKLINLRKLLKIELNKNEYARGKVFCNDIKETFKGEINRFDIEKLIYVLYMDFLEQVRDGLSHKDIAAYLAKNKMKYYTVQQSEVTTLVQVTKKHFKLKTGLDFVNSRSDDTTILLISMKETELLRGETLLNDIEHLIVDYKLTVEELLTILYLEFIDDIKKEGITRDLQLNIINMI